MYVYVHEMSMIQMSRCELIFSCTNICHQFANVANKNFSIFSLRSALFLHYYYCYFAAFFSLQIVLLSSSVIPHHSAQSALTLLLRSQTRTLMPSNVQRNNCKERRNCVHRDYCGAFVAFVVKRMRRCVQRVKILHSLYALFEEFDVEKKHVGMLVYYFCFVLLLYSWYDSPFFFAFDPVITAVYTHVIEFSPFFFCHQIHIK